MVKESRFPVIYGVFVLICALAMATAASPTGAQQAPAVSAPPVNVLDGKRFSGELVPAGKSSGNADDFIFAEGNFHSSSCLEWGFAPGPYWVRLVNGRLHFLAELKSEENGTMTYRGTIDGTSIDANVEWVKPRWYWTMERTFRFQGKIELPDAAGGG